MLRVLVLLGSVELATYPPDAPTIGGATLRVADPQGAFRAKVRVRPGPPGQPEVKVRLCTSSCEKWTLIVDSDPFKKSIVALDVDEPLRVEVQACDQSCEGLVPRERAQGVHTSLQLLEGQHQ